MKKCKNCKYFVIDHSGYPICLKLELYKLIKPLVGEENEQV